MKKWRIKRGAEQRFRRGHPWLFASELGHSSKEVWPGEIVELQDFQGHFLAYGYTNPNSQICFRRLSSRVPERDVLGESFYVKRLRAAHAFRVAAGVADVSHRWLFAEADGVPGLIIDGFLSDTEGWLVVVQASTAGIEATLGSVYGALKSLKSEFGEMSIVEAPTAKIRALERLTVGEKRMIHGQAKNLEKCVIRLQHGLTMACDLLNGQKTGFFLDQQANAGAMRGIVKNSFAKSERKVRILDICCYVGQWSSHAVHALRQIGIASEVTLVDVSQSALTLATQNVKALGAEVRAVKVDALQGVKELEPKYFDLVICDPPAFVKKKADLLQGLKAYVSLNQHAMERVSPGGLYVTSSCSGLVRGADWREVLVQAQQKSNRSFKEMLKGGHGPDHPLRPEFPEGEYLKCVLGQIDYPY